MTATLYTNMFAVEVHKSLTTFVLANVLGQALRGVNTPKCIVTMRSRELETNPSLKAI